MRTEIGALLLGSDKQLTRVRGMKVPINDTPENTGHSPLRQLNDKHPSQIQ